MELRYVSDSKGFNKFIQVWDNILDSRVEKVIKFSSSFLSDDFVDHVPGNISSDITNTMKTDCCSKCFFSTCVLKFSQIRKSIFKAKSLTESQSNTLYLIGNLIHPDIEESLSFFQYFLCHLLLEGIDFSDFFVVNKVFESFQIAHTFHSWNLVFRAHGHFWHCVLALLHIGHNIFNCFLHQYTVITLCSHT